MNELEVYCKLPPTFWQEVLFGRIAGLGLPHAREWFRAGDLSEKEDPGGQVMKLRAHRLGTVIGSLIRRGWMEKEVLPPGSSPGLRKGGRYRLTEAGAREYGAWAAPSGRPRRADASELLGWNHSDKKRMGAS